MNKRRIDRWIPYAKEAIEVTGIAKGTVVDKTFRAQISSFGAAVVMGSLKASVAFFTDDGGASVERSKLLGAMDYVIRKGEGEEKPALKKPGQVLEDVCRDDSAQKKEQFIDAAIAIKLALNFFELTENKAKDGE